MEANKIKMNIDGSIRAKVLQYKSDGNTLTEKTETLKKYADGVYYTEGTELYSNKPTYRLVFEKNGVFWHTKIIERAQVLETPEARAKVVELREVNFTNILETAKAGGYIRMLEIEVMRRLGYDTAPLFASRETYLKRREEEERQRAEEAARREQQRKEAEQRRKAELLADGKEKLMAHKAVTVEQIELLAEAVGYTIHGRTLGFMREKVSEAILREDKSVTIWGRKLTSRNISGTVEVICEIAARVKAQAEAEAQQPATATETPRISTETAEAVECATESETTQETAKMRIWRLSKPGYAKIIVGDYSQGKAVAILSHVSGKSYIEISDDAANVHTVGAKELSIAKPITELTDAEVYDIIYSWSPKPPSLAPQSAQTPQTANYATPTPKRRQRPRKQPHQQFKQYPQTCTK